MVDAILVLIAALVGALGIIAYLGEYMVGGGLISSSVVLGIIALLMVAAYFI